MRRCVLPNAGSQDQWTTALRFVGAVGGMKSIGIFLDWRPSSCASLFSRVVKLSLITSNCIHWSGPESLRTGRFPFLANPLFLRLSLFPGSETRAQFSSTPKSLRYRPTFQLERYRLSKRKGVILS